MIQDKNTPGLSDERRELLKLLLEDDHSDALPLRRNSRKGNFPLSFVQERMWLAEKFARSGAFVISINAEGRLNLEGLEGALNELVRRHEILRSTFDENAPLQTVHESLNVKVAVRDLRVLSESAREAETREFIREETLRPFDLVNGPLFRFSVFWLREEHYLIVFSVHHIIWDGWSARIFAEELAGLYATLSHGQPSPLTELPIQYGDYAVWQRESANTTAVREQLQYWKRQLGGDLPILQLPRDRSLPKTPTYAEASYEFKLSAKLYQEIERFSRREGVTPFMTLLTAFNTVLHVSGGQLDIPVGSPIANRNRVETENLIGCFMHPLVLRTSLAGDPSFRDLLARVRKVCLEAYANQDVPFELVVRELRPRWDGRHMPLFQVLFNVDHSPLHSTRLPDGLLFRPDRSVPSPNSALDMSVHLWTTREAVEVTWDYSTEQFDRTTIEWLARGYESILEKVVEDADRKLSTLGGWDLRETPDLSEASQQRQELLNLLLADQGSAAIDPTVSGDTIVRVERAGQPLRASFGQERLWFFEQLEPGLFNALVAVRLEGPLDVEVLGRCWQELARRQESFRTSFATEDGVLTQVIAPQVNIPLTQIDLTHLSKDDQQEQARKVMEQEGAKLFDLTRAPLLRLLLLRFAPDEHLLLVNAHHIITDGWSTEVWQRDFVAIYDAFVNGKPSPLPELTVQYADYAVWHRESLRGPRVHEELAYWKRQLGGELPVLELPVDRRRVPGTKRRRGATLAFDISDSVHQKLRALGRREGATLFATLLAAFKTLLYRYTGEADILVDAAVAGRNNPNVRGLVGFFVNSIILRTDLSGDLTFRTLLTRVKRVCLGALEHQEIPFDRVVAELGGRKGTGETLTPVSFMLHEAIPNTQNVGGGVRVLPVRGSQTSDEFDLTMYLWQEPDGFWGQLKYDPDLFDQETIRRMAGHFLNLLEAVAAEPEVKLEQISLLTKEERLQIVHQWNETREEIGDRHCVHQRFEAKADQNPDTIAVTLSKALTTDGQEYQLSYAELEKRANQLARHLANQGVRAETRIGLCVGRSLELAVGVLGILKSGGAYVPLDLSQPRERLSKVITDSGISLVVTREAERRKLGDLISGLTVVEIAESRHESSERLQPAVGAQNAAYVIYTSGSTGEPKGVVVSHASVVNHSAAVTRRFALEHRDRVLQFHTISFDAAVEELFPTWGVGATVVMRGEDLVSPGEELERLIAQERLTVLNLPTAYWHEWVIDGERRQKISADGLRLVIVGGDKASADRYAKWKELTGGGIKWVNTYGPTETTVISSLYEPGAEVEPEVYGGMLIGRPIGNTRTYVLDTRLEPVPVGVAGELWIGGHGLARGYLGRPDLTGERFVADPFVETAGARMYRTGDRVRYRWGGKLEFLSRVDDQVKIRGFRVEPGEVEAVLLKYPGVDKAVVVGWKTADSETRLAAYIVPSEVSLDESQLVPDLRRHLGECLPEYMVPSAFVLLATLPLSPSGKIDRRALPAPDVDGLHRERKATYSPPQTEIERTIAGIWQEVLDLPQVGLHDNFFDLGGHSLSLARVQNKLVTALKREIPLIELFRYPTIDSLTRFLSEDEAASLSWERIAARAQKQRNRGEAETGADAVAIVGMSGRFPKAPNIAAFWQTLRDGVEAITSFTDEELMEAGIGPALLGHPDYVKAAAVLEGIDMFDASFFGYNPREAEIMDPQRRLFLECAWEAIEDAGYDPARYPGMIGVFAGQGMSQYGLKNILLRADLPGRVTALLSNDKDYLATTVSYKFGLRGPSVSVQTACSTSLVAVCIAGQSLLNYQCDIALAGGVTLAVPQKAGYLYEQGQVLSPDGHCRAFDARAQGMVGGSGTGIVVLKRLSEALADGDTVHAVIRGFAMNNDGALKVGYTAPSIEGQAEVIAMAQAVAGVKPETITYVEAHGTGTPLGDPIEIAALTKAFRAQTTKKQFCAIASLKTNMGHMDAAAGVAGLIKTVLALKHKQIPPNLHYETPNPEIDFENSPFFVNSELTEWPANGEPRRAGVSSFGFGGTNAHVVLEEAPVLESAEPARPWQLILLSAKTASARDRMAANLATHLNETPDVSLADVAYTLQVGRSVFPHRLMGVCRDVTEAAAALQGFVTGDSQLISTNSGDARERHVIFMFPGQGAQQVNMGRELYDLEPVFRETIDRCCELLQPHLGRNLRDLLYPAAGEEAAAAHVLQQTAVTQPALFVVEYALSQLLQEWGVRPAGMIGHSLGEYVAACLAGVFSLEDGLALVAARGQLMQELPEGKMLAVPMNESDLQPLLAGNKLFSKLSLAAVNAPSLCVVSGPFDAVEKFESELIKNGCHCQRLHTSHAFHSSMMQPIVSAFTERINTMTLMPPKIPFLSNLTGTWITAEQATDSTYWAQHLRQTVQFAAGAQELLKDTDRILFEVGPGRTLSMLVKQQPEARDGRMIVGSLPRPQDKQTDLPFLLDSIGQLWLAGARIDWSGFHTHERRRRVTLPTYPFERQRYWIDAVETMAIPTERRESEVKDENIGDWFYAPVWQKSLWRDSSAAPDMVSETQSWLVLADTLGLGTQLVQRLETIGHRVVTVVAGAEFDRLDEHKYSVRCSHREDYTRLLQELREQQALPTRIVHLWNITASDQPAVTADGLDAALDTSFFSLLTLAQALADMSVAEATHIAVISNGLHEVTGEESLQPEKATLLGPMRVIPQEHPNISCLSIDVSLANGTERVLDQLIPELRAEPASGVVAFRGSRRWERSFVPVRLPEQTDETDLSKAHLREQGTYLITGGLGGVGLALAEYLAEQVRAKLVLIGRSALPPKHSWQEWLVNHSEKDRVSERIRKVQALEALGSEVLVVSADVCDRQQMRDGIDQARARFGKIDGVIHAAGIAGGSSADLTELLIQFKSSQSAREMLMPKVKGALVLDDLLAQEKLDFFAICSSVASALGGLGRVDYCAANAFLDAFAQGERHGRLTVSIDWDTWSEVGMAIVDEKLPPELEARRQEALKLGIRTREGMEAFGRILRSQLPQIVVSTHDFNLRLEETSGGRRSEVNDGSKSRGGGVALHSRPKLPNEYVGPRNEIEQEIAEIWGALLGIDQIGVNDDFFALGGHSLLATQIVMRVRHTFQIEVPMSNLFESPTIAGLARAVIEERSAQEDSEDLAAAVAALEQMSEEEVDALLSTSSDLPPQQGQKVSDG